MKVVYGIKHVKRFNNSVVAMGVFDGVHKAHQRILSWAVTKARAVGGKSIALTFWPHPQKEDSICSLQHRLRLIAALGIDESIVVQFNRDFSRISAKDFIEKMLVKRIGARFVCIGESFRFGLFARGDCKLLRHLAKGRYELKVFSVITRNRQPVSSTSIRRMIVQGNLNAAQTLLGRPVSIFGEVIHGSAFGRKLGFPTANINPHHEVLPPVGIYAVKVSLENEQLRGACYIGRKPFFVARHPSCVTRTSHAIEVHLFDFHRTIYGKYLELQFVKKIREPQRFSTPASLIKQIKKDITKVRTEFSALKRHHNI